MAKPVRPEPKFFLVDLLYERGMSYYARTWFDDLPSNCSLGEKSTNYLENCIVAERIRKNLPHVRIVFLLRNPIDRAYSNYLWTKQNGLESESFTVALKLEERRERELSAELRYARPFSYFSRGLYARHLEPYFEYFPREQILVMLQEDIAADPYSVACKFQSFLRVNHLPQLAVGLGLVNAVLARDVVMEPELRAILAGRYREPNQHLASLLGRDLQSWDQ